MQKLSKTIRLAVVAFLFLSSLGVSAQIDLKSNFLGFARNNYSLAGEYSISESMSAQLEVQYNVRKFPLLNLAQDQSTSTNEDIKLSGFTIMPSFRFYFSPDDPTEGFFVEPHFRYVHKGSSAFNKVPVTDSVPGVGNKTIEYDNVKFSIDNIGFGLNIGKKYVHESGFIFEMFAGGGKNFSSTVSSNVAAVNGNSEYQVAFEGIEILNSFFGRLGLSVGWRF